MSNKANLLVEIRISAFSFIFAQTLIWKVSPFFLEFCISWFEQYLCISKSGQESHSIKVCAIQSPNRNQCTFNLQRGQKSVTSKWESLIRTFVGSYKNQFFCYRKRQSKLDAVNWVVKKRELLLCISQVISCQQQSTYYKTTLIYGTWDMTGF